MPQVSPKHQRARLVTTKRMQCLHFRSKGFWRDLRLRQEVLYLAETPLGLLGVRALIRHGEGHESLLHPLADYVLGRFRRTLLEGRAAAGDRPRVHWKLLGHIVGICCASRSAVGLRTPNASPCALLGGPGDDLFFF